MKTFRWVPVSIVSLSSMLAACGVDESTQAGAAKLSMGAGVKTPADPKELTKAFLEARKDLRSPLAAESSARCCATADQ